MQLEAKKKKDKEDVILPSSKTEKYSSAIIELMRLHVNSIQ